MGAPTSSTLSEIFIQHIEHTQILNVLAKHDIITYSRYVDDILIIYKDTTSIEHRTLSEFNALHPNVHFTMEMEMDKKLIFFGYMHLQNTEGLTVRYIPKTHRHGHHDPQQIMPPKGTQVVRY
jgi:hypothetical protein